MSLCKSSDYNWKFCLERQLFVLGGMITGLGHPVMHINRLEHYVLIIPVY